MTAAPEFTSQAHAAAAVRAGLGYLAGGPGVQAASPDDRAAPLIRPA
jgi:hypothetical protein